MLELDEGKVASMKPAERILNSDMPDFEDKWRDE